MTREKQTFLNLIKSFVWNTHPEPVPSDVNWGEVVDLAMIHSDIGIIGYIFMKNPTLAPELNDYMRQQCLQTIALYAQRAEKMKDLILKLDENGIDHLLFKGFVIRDIYPIPELRSFGDIDFLIKLEDRDKCDRLMMEDHFERETEWEPVYSYLKELEYYEIHTDVMEVDVSDKADYKGYFQKIWEHAYNKPDFLEMESQSQSHTYLLDTEFHLLYLLTHIAKHISESGAGIRMYLDIAFYLKRYRDEINWDHFCGEVRKLAFEGFVNVVFTAVEQWFDVESPIPLRPVKKDVMDDFLDFTLDGGVFGHADRNYGENWLKQENRNDEEDISKTRALFHRAFPSAKDLELRYTYLKKCPWLLPAAWIHRLFLTREKWDKHAEQAIDIMNADTEKVKKLKHMYKEIGL